MCSKTFKVHADMTQDHISMALGQISNYPWCPSKINNTWDVHEDPKTMFILSISIPIWYRIPCLVDIDSPKTIAILGYCISCVAWLLYVSSWLYILCFSISLGVFFLLCRHVYRIQSDTRRNETPRWPHGHSILPSHWEAGNKHQPSFGNMDGTDGFAMHINLY